MSKVYWMSGVPERCETCDTPIGNVFYDAKTEMGPWACMCPSCQTLGPGLGKVGQGIGQEFTKSKGPDGKERYYKTAG